MKNERLFSGYSLLYHWVCTIMLLSVIFVAADAQQPGAITGKVITEGGKGIPQIQVLVYPAGSGARRVVPRRAASVATDEDGRFQFADLPPYPYRIDVRETREYARLSIAGTERRGQRYFYIGDKVTITMVKGGAITGKVTTPEGDPMMRAQVSPIMVRDAEGNPIRQSVPTSWSLADDRGIYRLFGLAPGRYLIFTNGSSLYSPAPTTQQIQAYHPSSTREKAVEVAVTDGGEVTGVDIVYRKDLGRVVSGTIAGGSAPPSTTGAFVAATGNVFLINLATGVSLSTSSHNAGDGRNEFKFYGVADGEYEIRAHDNGPDKGESTKSLPRRVRVKGKDVTGIQLKLAPAAAIAGRVVLEPSPGICDSKTSAVREEILVSAQRVDKSYAAPQSFIRQLLRSIFGRGGQSSARFISADYSLDDNGEFTIPYLDAGKYGIEPALPDKNWYVKSVAIPSGVSVAAAVSLKSGEKLTGLTVVIAEGAAGLQGKIVAEKEGSPLPSRLRVHLVPVEISEADNPLRYAETSMRSDRTFEFNNLAPGKYWLTARVISDLKSENLQSLPVAWDQTERAKLREKAEAGKIEVELKPCQRVSEQVLKF